MQDLCILCLGAIRVLSLSSCLRRSLLFSPLSPATFSKYTRNVEETELARPPPPPPLTRSILLLTLKERGKSLFLEESLLPKASHLSLSLLFSCAKSCSLSWHSVSRRHVQTLCELDLQFSSDLVKQRACFLVLFCKITLHILYGPYLRLNMHHMLLLIQIAY